MIRTAIITSVFALVTSSIVLAEDREASILNLGFEDEYFHKTDMNMSPREYEEIYSRNKRFVLNNLRSYSENALELIGIPEQGIHFMGAALGLAFGDQRLTLIKSKMLALEVKNVRDSERTLYLGVNLDW